jgi:hypothetical protein
MATSEENTRPSRRANHRPVRAARTRPKAAPSTAASTRINAPPGRAISIIPVAGICSGVDGFGGIVLMRGAANIANQLFGWYLRGGGAEDFWLIFTVLGVTMSQKAPTIQIANFVS